MHIGTASMHIGTRDLYQYAYGDIIQCQYAYWQCQYDNVNYNANYNYNSGAIVIIKATVQHCYHRCCYIIILLLIMVSAVIVISVAPGVAYSIRFETFASSRVA